MKRRDFIQNAVLAAGATALIGQTPVNSFDEQISGKLDFGFQVWTIREKINNDFAGTLSEMATLGYSQVEMCSPLGYMGAGFAQLHKKSGIELRKMVDDAGLKCVSSHFSFGELKSNLEDRIEWSKQMGISQMILASFGLPGDATRDDYRKACDELNKIGEKTKTAGIQAGFHNHHGEFEKRGETLIYDIIMEALNPECVKMQFQVAVVNIGYLAADFFRKYPGRFISAHLADWSDLNQKQVPVGQGIVDWNDFFMAAKTGGVKNYFVEMDEDTFKPSAEFLLNRK